MYGGEIMKKILVLLMCFTLFAGCSQKTTDDNNQNRTYTGTSDPNNDKAEDNDDWYGRFESGLGNKNIAYSAKSSIDASTIGGVEGYRYTTENGNIDVYRYEDGDELNRIMNEKKVTVDGVDRNVEVNGNYVIVSDGLSDDILNIFRGLK